MDDLQIKKKRLAQALGHNREHILNAYVGSFNCKAIVASVERCRTNIHNVLPLLEKLAIPTVDPSRIFDCQEIQQIVATLDVTLSLHQIQFLWGLHSRRYGVEWMDPVHEVGIGLEVSALTIIKNIHSFKLESV